MQVLLVSDEPAQVAGLQTVLPHLSHVATLKALPAAVEQSKPDVILIDLAPHVVLGWFQVPETARLLRANRAAIWCREIGPEIALHLNNLGVHGMIPKSLPLDAQVQALCAVQETGIYFERPLIERMLVSRSIALTHRESQIVSLITQGAKNKEIATALNIQEGTVKVYISRLYAKLQVKDRYELAIWAGRNQHGIDSTMPAILRHLVVPNRRRGKLIPAAIQ